MKLTDEIINDIFNIFSESSISDYVDNVYRKYPDLTKNQFDLLKSAWDNGETIDSTKEILKENAQLSAINEEVILNKRGSKIKSHVYAKGKGVHLFQDSENLVKEFNEIAEKNKDANTSLIAEYRPRAKKQFHVANLKVGNDFRDFTKQEFEKLLQSYKNLDIKHEKGVKVDFNKLSVESLHADYPLKNPEWVWDNWTIEQRLHFLRDHANESAKQKILKLKYSELTSTLQNEVWAHVTEGRYEHGKGVEKTNRETIIDQIRNFPGVKEIKFTDYGVEITPFYGDSDSYFPPTRLTRGELIALMIESFKNDVTKPSNIVVKREIDEYVNYLLKD